MSNPTEEAVSGNETRTDETHPTHEEISVRAYEIYVERGGAHGRDVDDWLRAERELVAKCKQTRPKARAVTV